MTKHPLGLGLAGGWEVGLGLLAVLATLLAVGHDDGEPIEQPIADGGQLLGLALGRLGGVTYYINIYYIYNVYNNYFATRTHRWDCCSCCTSVVASRQLRSHCSCASYACPPDTCHPK